MSKATAKVIEGLQKDCPACGSKLQGKMNIHGNIFFRCDAHVSRETGKVMPKKTSETIRCYYRENFGIAASEQVRNAMGVK